MEYSGILQIVIIALIVVLLIGVYICLYNQYYKGIFNIICFAFFVSVIILCMLVLNDQTQNTNNIENKNMENLGIINTYLETINPLIEMADEEGNPLYYPGIDL